MAQVAHLPGFTSVAGAEVVALAEPADSVRDEVADRFGVVHRFEDYREMLSYGRLDGVVVAVPRRAQSAVVRDVVSSGLPVLSEKPLAFTASVAADLQSRAETHGLMLAVGYMRRHDPGVRLFAKLLADALANGDMGQLLTVRMHDFCGSYAVAIPPHIRVHGRNSRYAEDPSLPDFLTSDNASAYDRTVNVAVHDLNLLRHLFDCQPRAMAFASRSTGTQVMMLDLGVCDCVLSVGPANLGHWDQRLDVVFGGGSLSLVMASPLAIQDSAHVIRRMPGREEVLTPPSVDRHSLFAHQAAAFVAALAGRGTGAMPNAAEAARDLSLIDELWRRRHVRD